MTTNHYDGVQMILAPMVRASQLALRLEAIEYGADLVYSEETIAKKIIGCTRVQNPHFPGVVEYYNHRERSSPLRTCEAERKKLVFQLGVADSHSAQEAALLVAQDVFGVDVNMGCPKSFSVKGGMGAALMKSPEVASDILKTLRRVLPAEIAVSCKTRMFDDIGKTAEYVKMCHQSGAAAVAVHMRTEKERPSTRARWDGFARLRELCPGIFLIANGDFFNRKQLDAFKDHVGADAYMIARGAQYCPSIFSPREYSKDEVMQRYVRRAIAVGGNHQSTKWNLATMATQVSEVFDQNAREWNNNLTYAKSLTDIAGLCNVEYAKSEWPPLAHTVQYSKETLYDAIVDKLPLAAQSACVITKEDGTTVGTKDDDVANVVPENVNSSNDSCWNAKKPPSTESRSGDHPREDSVGVWVVGKGINECFTFESSLSTGATTTPTAETATTPPTAAAAATATVTTPTSSPTSAQIKCKDEGRSGTAEKDRSASRARGRRGHSCRGTSKSRSASRAGRKRKRMDKGTPEFSS